MSLCICVSIHSLYILIHTRRPSFNGLTLVSFNDYFFLNSLNWCWLNISTIQRLKWSKAHLPPVFYRTKCKLSLLSHTYMTNPLRRDKFAPPQCACTSLTNPVLINKLKAKHCLIKRNLTFLFSQLVLSATWLWACPTVARHCRRTRSNCSRPEQMPGKLPPLIPLADIQWLFLYEANWKYCQLNSPVVMVNAKCWTRKRVLSQTIKLLDIHWLSCLLGISLIIYCIKEENLSTELQCLSVHLWGSNLFIDNCQITRRVVHGFYAYAHTSFDSDLSPTVTPPF